MRALPSIFVVASLAIAPTASAQSADPMLATDGAAVAIGIREIDPQLQFTTLTWGRVLVLGGQSVFVMQEPGPAAIVDEAPPAPAVAGSGPPEPPFTGAIWVSGHWTHTAGGFMWVDGRFIAPKQGHVFVPPRWAFVGQRFLFFSGFFVPHRVLVRSFFNTLHFSGDPTRRASSATRDRGPYWPLGVSGRPVGLSSSKGRGPYWPLGLGPPTVVSSRRVTPVGLPSATTGR